MMRRRGTPDHPETEQERYEREKREDLAEWDEFLRTGIGVPGEEVGEWLERRARGEAAPPPKARCLWPSSRRGRSE